MSATPRYTDMPEQKRQGATATPPLLARALAQGLLQGWRAPVDRPVRILDPAVGDGVLVEALLDALEATGRLRAGQPPTVQVHDVSREALDRAQRRLALRVPGLQALHGDFLEATPAPFDLIIANPPWVRTQVLGSAAAQALARRHGLRGRIDLSHAFLVRIAELLAPGGHAGVYVSNKLLSTRGAAALRAVLGPQLRALWDLGDTRLFAAAVLPAAVFLRGPEAATSRAAAPMLRVHCTAGPARPELPPLELLHSAPGLAALPDGTPVELERGEVLQEPGGGPWRLQTAESQRFLETVAAHTGALLGELGPIKVGVKSTADAVFLRSDWETCTPVLPRLLRPATTHRSAHPLCPRHPQPAWRMLYPHRVEHGRRQAVPLEHCPASAAWLHAHEARLRSRRYLQRSARAWYELWVPHDPDGWAHPKLVWRDIAARPCLWVDLEGTVVNGDCYWLPVESADDPRLWAAAAVGCSRLALQWYDHACGNRLYAGRRRFLAQYMERLPLPGDPAALQALAATARGLYAEMLCAPASADFAAPLAALDAAVWRAFGLAPPPPAASPR